MKRFLKRTLAMFLCLTMVMGMGLVSGVISAPVANAAETSVGASPKVIKYDGTSPKTDATGIISYADLEKAYGTATGADGLTDGFLYIATEYYEADGSLTDYYVQPGDKLTAKVYIKSNMKTGDGYVISFYNNTYWDAKIVADGATTDDNGYTSNYSGGVVNPNHPAITTNGYSNVITSINITKAGWIKNTCGFDASYLAATDLVQTNTSTNIDVGSAPYQMTSDEWVYAYYVTVKDDVAQGTEIVVESPDVIWQSYINGKKHDARKRAYIGCGHITNDAVTDVTNVKTMANQMDSGALDYFINGLNHTFVVGEPPAPEAAKTVTFMVDGEVYGEVKEYNEGDAIDVPDAPSKEGYIFAGWDSTPGVMGTESLVFNATWTPIKYNVSFDNDGEVTSGEYDCGSVIVLPQPAEKEGHSFIGWFDEGGNEYTAESTVPVGGVNLTAKYEKNTYKAVFDAAGGAWEDGENQKSVFTEYGAQIDAPADPAKEGYEFIGWNQEVGTMTAEDVVFIAMWQIQSYNVTWDFDNGEEAQVNEVLYGNPVIAPEEPVKEGYTFAGWDAEIPDAMPANALSFKALWTVNEYTVTWDIDGETTEETFEYGAAIVAPADPEKEGYTFTGWEGYAEGMKMPAENLTFKATWEINEYTVAWDVDGAATEETYEYGAAIVAPADPEKEGYTFIGWTPSIPDAMPAEDLSFTAVFEINSYTVTWDVDGVTEEETYNYGDSIAIPTPPEKKGYTFAGWDPEIPDTMPAKNITLTAKWDKIIITSVITLDANGGKFSNGAPVYPVSAEVGVPFNAVPADPTRDGYTFIGWADEDGNATSIPKYFPEEDVTIKAVWAEGEGNVYAVETYTMNVNGEYGKAEVAYYTTEDATVTLAPEAEEGFYVDTDNSALEAEVAADGSTVLKVYLAREKYTVTFDANGGNFSGEAVVSEEVYYGAAIEEPAAPVMDEYTFIGWDAEIPEAMPAENLTFKATWELAHTHVLVLVTEEATCTEEGKKYYVCDDCGETVGEVEVIAAKGHVAGEWTVKTEATTEAEGLAVKKCTVCDEIVETSVISKLPVPPVNITTEDGETFESGSEVAYGESVTLTVGNLPESSTVEWTVEGEGVEITVSEDGKTCTVTSVSSGKATVKATVTDANGNKTVTETNIVSDACFFQRLVHFLKNIFSFNIFGYIFSLIF